MKLLYGLQVTLMQRGCVNFPKLGSTHFVYLLGFLSGSYGVTPSHSTGSVLWELTAVVLFSCTKDQ